MPISTAEKLAIYRRNLAAYEQEGDADKVQVQKALIKRIEKEP